MRKLSLLMLIMGLGGMAFADVMPFAKKRHLRPCEELVANEKTDVPDAAIISAEMLQPPGALVCLIRWAGGGFKQDSLYFEKEGKPALIASTGKSAAGECGSASQSLSAEVITVKIEGEKVSALAIETVTTTDGCCGHAEMKQARVQLFNLKTKVLTAPSLGSNYCQDDKACGKSFCSPHRAGVNSTGTKFQFDWARCTKGDVCEKILFSKTDVATKKKPLPFILKWDGGAKLDETAY